MYAIKYTCFNQMAFFLVNFASKHASSWRFNSRAFGLHFPSLMSGPNGKDRNCSWSLLFIYQLNLFAAALYNLDGDEKNKHAGQGMKFLKLCEMRILIFWYFILDSEVKTKHSPCSCNWSETRQCFWWASDRRHPTPCGSWLEGKMGAYKMDQQYPDQEPVSPWRAAFLWSKMPPLTTS